MIGVCPSCKSAYLNIQHNISRKRGLAHLLSITCPDWVIEFYTSKEVKKMTITLHREEGMFAINLQSCIAFREIGKGLTGMETFCTIMNCPPPMNLEADNNIGNKMHHAYVEASRKSMLLAAKETHSNAVKETDDGTNDATVSVDGTWQCRGYSSLNGVVTAIYNGKAIDTETLSKNCKSCKYWDNKKGTPEYDE